MITKFDKNKLISLIQSFYNLTGIKVAIYDSDFCEIMAYPAQNSSVCTLVQNTPASCNKCSESTQALCRKCAALQTVIIEKCHAGLIEVIAPLFDGISVIGYIMFGQVTTEKSSSDFLKTLIQKCQKYNLCRDELAKFSEEIPYYSYTQLEDAAKILNAIAVYIVSDHLAYSDELSYAYRIAKYVKDNLQNNLSVATLCSEFYLSKSEIYKITKNVMPQGVAAFVKHERIEKAADLLIHSQKPIWKIAEETGFSNEDYFLRVFKKEKGISALKWRNTH